MGYSQVDLNTISARIEDRGGDDGVFWTAPERQGAINEALCVWQALTGHDTDYFIIDGSSGVGNFFPIPRQVVSPQRVLYNGTELVLISEWELDQMEPGWEGTLATPTTPPLYWAPLGFTEILIWPAPTTGAIQVEGITEADLLENGGDFIDEGYEELTKLLGYAHYYLTIKEAGLESQSSMENVTPMFEAAAYMNGRLKETNCYKRALGLIRDDNEKPRADSPSSGARLSQ